MSAPSAISFVQRLSIGNQGGLVLEFNPAGDGWREKLDELKATIPAPQREHTPSGAWLISTAAAPELLKLVAHQPLDPGVRERLLFIAKREVRRREG
jgi:hypothetical protein